MTFTDNSLETVALFDLLQDMAPELQLSELQKRVDKTTPPWTVILCSATYESSDISRFLSQTVSVIGH